MSVTVLVGDCRDVLKTLPDASVHCCVTSPPYFGLRDYGCAGQMGLEPTPAEYVAGMVAVFADVRRVLRDDGTVWLNIGDSYAGSWGAQSREHAGKHAQNVSALSANQVVAAQRRASGTGSIPAGSGLKSKDLIGIPWMLAFALRADGWWLRQDIIWHKPNPMPESITDRCTKAHEYVFLLSKRQRYYFNAGAIAEGSGDDRMRTKAGLVEIGPRDTRNKRSVWTVASSPFADAHFATFPPALIEPCILAGCPLDGTVLDPFGGAGTTGLVADRHQRSAILIELNPVYADMARKRIAGDAPLLVNVA